MNRIERQVAPSENSSLLPEEQLYRRLARLRGEYLQGLETVEVMFASLRREHATRSVYHRLLCLAESAVGQSLQALALMPESPPKYITVPEGKASEDCSFCSARCRKTAQSKTGRVA